MSARTGVPPDRSAVDVIFILLALQSGFGFVSSVGTIAFAVLGGIPVLLFWGLAVGVGVPATLAVAAFGIQRGRRWAWKLVLVFEALLILGTVLRLLFGLLPQSELLALTTGAALPLLVDALLLSGGVRALFRKPAPEPVAPAQSSGAIFVAAPWARRQAGR